MNADQEVQEPGESPSPVQSRTEAFGQGHQGAAGTPAWLEATEAQQAAESPHGFGGFVPAFHPTGLNMQVMPSGIGSSDQDKGRMLLGGGFLPTMNGSSSTSYQERRPFQSSTIGGVA